MDELLDFERNDLAGLMDFWEKHVRAGTWTPDMSQVASRLLDDPVEFWQRVERRQREDPELLELAHG